MSEERNLMVVKSDIPDVHEALAWAVQTLDREFSDASMVSMSVEQVFRSDISPDSEWRYVWTASVRGMISEKP